MHQFEAFVGCFRVHLPVCGCGCGCGCGSVYVCVCMCMRVSRASKTEMLLEVTLVIELVYEAY